MAAARQVLPEIFDQILGELEALVWPTDGIGGGEDDKFRPYRPSCVLHPILFVSRWWYAAVERRIYRSISLGEKGTKWAKAEVADHLADTLQSSTRAAGLVRTLRLHMPNGALVDNNHIPYARILARCTELTSLRIHGWECTASGFQQLKACIRGLSKLTRLTIDLDGYARHPVSLFQTSDETLEHLLEWPNLSSFTVSIPCLYRHFSGSSDNGGRGDGTDAKHRDTLAAANQGNPLQATPSRILLHGGGNYFSQLKELRLSFLVAMNDGHLRALATMAPKLSAFSYTTTDADLYASRVAFQQAIRLWAPHLQELLVVCVPSRERQKSGPDWPILDKNLCRELAQLRILACVGETLVPIAALVHLVSLTGLYFAPTRPEHVHRLTTTMPQLSSLGAFICPLDYLDGTDDERVTTGLKATCVENGIRVRFDVN